MHTMSRALSVFVLLLTTALAGPANALEKRLAPIADLEDSWNASGTIMVSYYNACNGYVWLVSDWSTAGESFGVRLGEAWPFVELSQTWTAVYHAMPQGYGYTGTISLIDGTECTDPIVASRPFSPTTGTTFNVVYWHYWLGYGDLTVLVTMQSPPDMPRNDGALALDIMNAGLSPNPCAAHDPCAVQDRDVHTYYYGVANWICSGTPWIANGRSCLPSELQHVMVLWGLVALEDMTWGRIKSLYE